MPHARHRMAESVQPAFRLDIRLGGRRKYHARGAQSQRNDARYDCPSAHAARRLISAAGHHRGAGPQSSERRSLCRDLPRDLRPFVAFRQPLGRDVQRGQHLRRPIATLQIEEQHAGPVGLVHRVLAGQPETHVVLRQQDVRGAGVDLRLVFAHPEDLRRREAGQHLVAGEGEQPVEAKPLGDLVALLTRALIVPEDRRPEHPIVAVEHRQPVHLAGHADGAHIVAGRARLCQRAADAGSRAFPPLMRILLRPERAGRGDGQLGGRAGDHCPLLIDQQRLSARRRDIYAEKKPLCSHHLPRWSVRGWPCRNRLDEDGTHYTASHRDAQNWTNSEMTGWDGRRQRPNRP